MKIINTVLFVIAVAWLPPALAEVKISNEIVKFHYDEGVKAFKEKDYLNALKHLAIFQVIGVEKLKSDPKLAKGVQQRIDKAEAALRGIAVKEPKISPNSLTTGSGFHFHGIVSKPE